MTSIEKIRFSLKNSKTSIGTWMQIPSTEIAEILSASNSYDWIVVDMEHGSFSRSQLPSIVRAIEMYSISPFVRLQTNNLSSVKNVVDCGFKGFIIPMIEDINQLNKIKEAIMYPPKGKRGVGFSTSNQYGINFTNAIEDVTQAFIVAMIETKLGLQNLEEILTAEYLDAIIIGPYDLSASLGVCGDFESDIFKGAFEKIKNLCNKFETPFGIHLVEPSNSKLKKSIEDGAKFIAFSMDTVMLYSIKPEL